MCSLVQKTQSAYAYPLLIKSLFFSPVIDNPDQEIVYREDKRFTYREFLKRVCQLANTLVTIGIKQVYPGKYAPSLLLSLIKKEKVTFSHCVPTILHMLIIDPSFKDLDLSRWKVVIGGAAMSKALCKVLFKKGADIKKLQSTFKALSIKECSPSWPCYSRLPLWSR